MRVSEGVDDEVDKEEACSCCKISTGSREGIASAMCKQDRNS